MIENIAICWFATYFEAQRSSEKGRVSFISYSIFNFMEDPKLFNWARKLQLLSVESQTRTEPD